MKREISAERKKLDFYIEQLQNDPARAKSPLKSPDQLRMAMHGSALMEMRAPSPRNQNTELGHQKMDFDLFQSPKRFSERVPSPYNFGRVFNVRINLSPKR